MLQNTTDILPSISQAISEVINSISGSRVSFTSSGHKPTEQQILSTCIMAILKDIEVTIEVDGQPLQEYDEIDEGDPENLSSAIQDSEDSDEAPNDGMPHLMSKYIEATSGARFAIKFVVPKSFKTISETLFFECYLDGSVAEDWLETMRKEELKHDIWRLVVKGSSRETRTGRVLRPFMFNKIKRSK